MLKEFEISEDNNKSIVNEWIDAINSHDLSRIVFVLDPEEFVWELGLNSTKGSEASKEAWKLFFEAFPDFNFKIEQMISSGDTTATRILMTGTHTGPLKFRGTQSMEKSIPPSGKSINVPGCAIHQIRNNKIIHLWAYWDTATMLRQIGAL